MSKSSQTLTLVHWPPFLKYLNDNFFAELKKYTVYDQKKEKYDCCQILLNAIFRIYHVHSKKFVQQDEGRKYSTLIREYKKKLKHYQTSYRDTRKQRSVCLSSQRVPWSSLDCRTEKQLG